MSYQVLARKWRPRQFEDVVGQEHVIRTLTNAIESDRIAHAYLFVGPRGIGKTSIARIFAKALNCQSSDGPTATPCDVCDSCKEIAAGRSLDVMEIDGASNNKVDEVRDLREAVRFAPTRSRYKIYIIDEVHMLTTQAFNALLKTLEEPPAHVKFMFATTEPEKVLPTIVSRCQRFDLRRIEASLIAERLEMIAAEDGIEADRDALRAVARGAEGGMRDAQSALDQLISFCGKTIHEEDVLTVFGLVSTRTLEQLVLQIVRGDVSGLLETVASLDAAGKNLERLAYELMEHSRHLLVCLNVSDPSKLLDIGEEGIHSLNAIAGETDTEKVLRVADILAETTERLRYALSKRTLLETALVRAARAASVVSVEDILAKLAALEAGGVGQVPGGSSGGVSTPVAASDAAPAPAAPPVAPPPKRKPRPTPPPAGAGQDATPKPAHTPKAAAAPAPLAAGVLGEIQGQWRPLVAEVGCKTLGMQEVLMQTAPVAITDGVLQVDCLPEAYARLGKKAPTRIVKALGAAVSGICDREIRIAFAPADELPELQAATPQVPADPPPADDTADAAASAAPRVSAQTLMEDPKVQMLLDNFNGTITDVREAH